jgi:hypothetical protein
MDLKLAVRGVSLSNPRLAFGFFAEQIPAASKHDTTDFLRSYGESVTEERLAEAKRYLLDLAEPRLRMVAVYAIERMHRNGLDISGLEPLLDAPVVELERLAREGSDADAGAAYRPMYAVEYNKICWSERAVTALEGAAQRIPRRAADLRKVAVLIRTGRKPSGWHGGED